jgi:nitrate/nitrite transporter NarK
MSDETLHDRPLGELMGTLSRDLGTLVRQEIDLAKAEMTQKGKKAGLGAGMFGGAGVAGLLALVSLTITAILLLNAVMKDWLAALIVTLAWGAVAAVLAMRGRTELREMGSPVPEQTAQTIKEDVQWAKNPTSSAGR